MTTLIPLELKNQRVLTTQQLAEAYETDVNNIRNNFSNHKDNFTEGVHYYHLQGEELTSFKNYINDIDAVDIINKRSPSLYLWTDRGASRHCKILDTDKAWEQFDNLEDTYFRVKEHQATLTDLSPQLQLLINIEREQKQQAQQLTATNTKLDAVADIIALDTNAWRTDCRHMITRIATALGAMDRIRDVNAMIYELLDKRFGVSLAARLNNLRARMAVEGVCKSKQEKVTKVDVIAMDKKLIEGYVIIVKELAIKHGVWKEVATA